MREIEDALDFLFRVIGCMIISIIVLITLPIWIIPSGIFLVILKLRKYIKWRKYNGRSKTDTKENTSTSI